MLIAESVSNFSGLWFLLIEDLYNGEGSLKANKSCNKSVKLHFFYSVQNMIQWQDTFPFLKENSRKIKCRVYIMHGEFSESFPD